jgi:hypothetical protein
VKPPTLDPLFDPQMLDRAAAGNIDGLAADRELSKQARELPCHRYDWYISGDDCPYETKSKVVPEPFRVQPQDISGEPIPWTTWNVAARVQHLVIHFTNDEILAMQRAAATVDSRISKHDAILGHVWNLIIRARGLSEDTGDVFLDYTLGLRGRTNPPLGDRFVGSPIIMTAIRSTGGDAAGADAAAKLAAQVRDAVSKFTPAAVAAHLHDKAYDQHPQRLWQGFFGKRHLMTASWIHTRVYEVDFGFGSPRYVQPAVPRIDGLFQLMEAKPTYMKTGTEWHWSDDGVDCQLYLEAESAENLLADPLLWKYARDGIELVSCSG